MRFTMHVLTAATAVIAAIVPGSPARAENTRTLRWETVVHAPVAEAWRLFTTEEGLSSWGPPEVEMDWRIGGTIRANHEAGAGPDHPGWITHHILSYEPERMYSTRVTVPDNAPFLKVIERSWGVARFEPLGPRTTRVVISSCGWGEGPEWDAAERFFNAANPMLFERLHAMYPPDEGAAERLTRALAGVWEFSVTRGDGSVFRGRTEANVHFDGAVLVATGLLGDANSLNHHSHFLAYRDNLTRIMRFECFMETGAQVRGDAWAEGENTLVLDWNSLETNGERRQFRVEYRFDGPDAYRLLIFGPGADHARGADGAMIDVEYRRIADEGAADWSRAMNTSGTERFIENPLVTERVVAAPRAEVWRAFTTNEGVRRFFAQGSDIELRPGGPYELHFLPDAPPGSRGADGCVVLAYVNEETLAFSWNAPPSFPVERALRTFVVVNLTDEPGGGTRVRLTHGGWREGGKWSEVRAYFDRAWETVLGRLTQTFETGEPVW